MNMQRRKSIMTFLCAMLACLLLACAFSGCSGRGKPAPSEEPQASEAPDERYEMIHIVRYWPEDADYDTCDYACVAEMPKFSLELTSGYAMNREVEAYYDELCQRIETICMPSSNAEPPYTEVTCRVETVSGVTNVVFTEKHCYDIIPSVETHVLMLNERGERINLCDVFLNYHTEGLIAGAIKKRIENDARYYDADLEKLLTLIDINTGALVREDGCTVFIREGKLAPYEEGELSFDISFAEAAPDFVGENGAVTLEEYRDLTELLAFVSDGVIVRQDNIENGSVSEYAASSFMGELAQTLGIAPKAGRIPVPEEQFLSLFKECFGTEFPGIDTDGHDIKLENGFYKVRYVGKQYRYNVDITEAVREGSVLSLSGDVIFGDFGYSATQYLCHVRIRLHKNSASPYGFTLESFVLSL